MNTIERTLAQVPQPDGFVSAELVDLGTGQVLAGLAADQPDGQPDGRAADGGGLAGAGDPKRPAHALAAIVTEMLHRLGALVAVRGDDDDVEDLVITTTRHHHLVRFVPGLGGTDAFLLVTLDRSRANLALARHLLLRLEATVVA